MGVELSGWPAGFESMNGRFVGFERHGGVSGEAVQGRIFYERTVQLVAAGGKARGRAAKKGGGRGGKEQGAQQSMRLRVHFDPIHSRWSLGRVEADGSFALLAYNLQENSCAEVSRFGFQMGWQSFFSSCELLLTTSSFY